MNTNTNINRSTFWTISILTVILSGLLTLINLSEFYLIGILHKTADYPFGGEGPTPYYYKTPELYSLVALIWGILFLTTLLFAIRAIFKGQQNIIFWPLGLTALLILGQFLHGKIGI